MPILDEKGVARLITDNKDILVDALEMVISIYDAILSMPFLETVIDDNDSIKSDIDLDTVIDMLAPDTIPKFKSLYESVVTSYDVLNDLQEERHKWLLQPDSPKRKDMLITLKNKIYDHIKNNFMELQKRIIDLGLNDY